MKSHHEMPAGKPSKHGVTKSSKSRSEKDVSHEEMQALLTKLKELVPNMPKNKKLSKLEIIQYVIDYIVDLQIALETHPTSRSCVNSPTPRQPLGVISPASNTVLNTCSSQETNHVEKHPQHIPELVSSTTRPVSC